MLAVEEQPLASVTVKVYAPAERVNEPVPVYGVVPPVALTVSEALPPLQRIAFVTVAEAVRTVGSEIDTAAEAVQPLASVIVKL